jgi:putative nucleotidyltransferase with HDIG domain
MSRMPIVSLQQAVARLGLGAITEIAFVASLRSGTFKVPGYEVDLQQLWWHAIASAAFAKEIARLKRANVESAFLCGLLHAIGKPALLQLLADVERELGEPVDGKGALRAAMPALLGEFHVRIGGQIAQLWRLPPQVVHAIAYHEDCGAAPAYRLDAMITHLADRFATELLHPEVLGPGELRKLPVFAELNLYDGDVEALVGKRADVARAVAAMGS